MKNKRGFTLIELLAIIVILAVIAVITTPIILNIIENSKKGAAQNSALGYKDAIHKYYAFRLSLDSSFMMADHIYEIVENGYLSYTDSNDSSNSILYEILFDGKVPNGGYVELEKNKVTNACIEFDDYSVLISDGSVSGTAKGECISISEIGGYDEPTLAVGTEYLFPYISEGDNKEQTLVIPITGYYKLEVWGASGGGPCKGYGGYSSGVIKLDKDKELFINVGGSGTNGTSAQKGLGGYNGGGSGGKGYENYSAGSGGGGATSIALVSGTLSSLEQYKGNLSQDGTYYVSEKILIVSGGGAGGSGWCYENNIGGAGGGIYGNEPISSLVSNPNYSASQISGYSFGLGMDAGDKTTYADWGAEGNGGGGGGFYGGNASVQSGQNTSVSGGGGSGYIGNSKLIDGVMYCYDCVENGNVSTRTISTTGFFKDSVSCPDGYSEDALSNCAKVNDGYAKITYIGKSYSSGISSGTSFAFSYVKREDNKEQVLSIPKTGYYKLEVWGASGGNASNTYTGGYGGYSTGYIRLDKDEKLYINVGGQGIAGNGSGIKKGGYNGGGSTTETRSETYEGSGGGATSIANSTGLLKDVNSENVVIVAGGGGGGSYYTGGQYSGRGGSGGGFIGVSGVKDRNDMAFGTGGTQSTGGTNSGLTGLDGSYGQGGTNSNSGYVTYGCAGGGGGYFGGGGSFHSGAGGGSGYIGYSELSNGVMYCYECSEDGNSGTMTISTTGDNKDSLNCPDSYSNNPLSNCAKAGNGYAIITYIGESLN